jgi:hypothetical protein
MGNNFVTNGPLVLEAFAIELYNELELAAQVYRKLEDKFEMERPQGEAKFGTKLTQKKPKRFRAADGPDFVAQDISEQTFDVEVDTWKHVGLNLSVFDATFKTAEELMDKAGGLIKPAVMTLADQIDLAVANRAKNLYQITGTPGVTPGDTSVVAMTTAQTQRDFVRANAIGAQQGVPEKMQRKGFYEPFAAGYVPVALSSLFVKEAQEAVTNGRLGHVLGVDLYKSVNMPYQTSGTAPANGTAVATPAVGGLVKACTSGTLVINGANQTGSSIAVSGGSAAETFKAGDIVQFGSNLSATHISTYGVGQHPVNVVNGAVFKNRAMTFVITADVTLDGNGAGNLSIYPSIVIDGAYQNCNVAPVNGATVLAYQSHQCNMVIVPETIALVCVPLKKLQGAVYCERINYKDLSLMMTVGADVKTMQDFARIDVIFGTAIMYGETGVRHMG